MQFSIFSLNTFLITSIDFLGGDPDLYYSYLLGRAFLILNASCKYVRCETSGEKCKQVYLNNITVQYVCDKLTMQTWKTKYLIFPFMPYIAVKTNFEHRYYYLVLYITVIAYKMVIIHFSCCKHIFLYFKIHVFKICTIRKT